MGAPCTDVGLERRYLVSAMYSRPEYVTKHRVPPHEFTIERHAILASAIFELVAAGEVPNQDRLIQHLETRGQMREIGGHDGLTGILSAELSADLGDMAKRLRTMAQARKLREVGLKVAELAQSYQLAEARSSLSEALEMSQDESHPYTLLSASDTAWEACNNLIAKADKIGGAPTGIPLLDSYVGRLGGGTMTVVGGQTGVGKSSVLMAMAMGMANRGTKVGIVSLEDPAQVWGAKVISHLTNVSGAKMFRQQLDKDDVERAVAGINAANDLGIHFAYAISRPVVDILDAIRDLVRDHGCQVIMVDYIQRVRVDARAVRRDAAFADAAGDLKGMCARLNVPLVLGSQLNRPDKGNPFREPHNTHLKETGDLENSAEVIALLWRKSDKANADTFGKLSKIKWAPAGCRFRLERSAYSGAIVDAIETEETQDGQTVDVR